MVALPDAPIPDKSTDQVSAPELIASTRDSDPVKRALLAGFGVGTLMAALGVWIVPVDEGDTAMQLVKLVFSITMLGLGMLFISALDNSNIEPEIHLDPRTRQLRIITRDKRGNPVIAGDYKLDELSDISLKDRYFSARDVKGEEIVSVPVRSNAAERALREALGQAG